MILKMYIVLQKILKNLYNLLMDYIILKIGNIKII